MILKGVNLGRTREDDESPDGRVRKKAYDFVVSDRPLIYSGTKDEFK
jgi:hypothetical protein